MLWQKLRVTKSLGPEDGRTSVSSNDASSDVKWVKRLIVTVTADGDGSDWYWWCSFLNAFAYNETHIEEVLGTACKV